MQINLNSYYINFIVAFFHFAETQRIVVLMQEGAFKRDNV